MRFGWQNDKGEIIENPLRYHLRQIDQRDTKPNIEEIEALLPCEGESLEEFAKRVRQRWIGRKKATVEYVTMLCNLTYHKSFSVDYYYQILLDATQLERRRQQHLRKCATYRAKNRALLSQKQLARYYAKKNSK